VGVRPHWARKIAKVEHSIRASIRGLVRRAVLSSLSEDGLQRFSVETLAGPRTVEYVQHYGFCSSPPPGSEAVIVGDRVMFAVACDNRSKRPSDLASGESAQYGPNTGQVITCKADGSIVVEPMAGQALKIGANATDDLVLADKFMTWHNALWSGVVIAPNDGGAAIKTAMVAASGAGKAASLLAVSATKAKAE